jgi:hypothetical protein
LELPAHGAGNEKQPAFESPACSRLWMALMTGLISHSSAPCCALQMRAESALSHGNSKSFLPVAQTKTLKPTLTPPFLLWLHPIPKQNLTYLCTTWHFLITIGKHWVLPTASDISLWLPCSLNWFLEFPAVHLPPGFFFLCTSVSELLRAIVSSLSVPGAPCAHLNFDHHGQLGFFGCSPQVLPLLPYAFCCREWCLIHPGLQLRNLGVILISPPPLCI